MNSLHERIIDISYKHKLSHLGSCLSSVNIIDHIYNSKQPDERFVNSCAHNSLALYVVLEKHYGYDAEQLFLKHGVHCNRDEQFNIDCSGGSLGQGICIAFGMALSDRTKNVWCLVSDGELAEGSCWEIIRLYEDMQIKNLFIYVNWNGFSAYDPSSKWVLNNLPKGFFVCKTTMKIEYLKGLAGHYKTLDDEQYKIIKQAVKNW